MGSELSRGTVIHDADGPQGPSAPRVLRRKQVRRRLASGNLSGVTISTGKRNVPLTLATFKRFDRRRRMGKRQRQRDKRRAAMMPPPQSEGEDIPASTEMDETFEFGAAVATSESIQPEVETVDSPDPETPNTDDVMQGLLVTLAGGAIIFALVWSLSR